MEANKFEITGKVTFIDVKYSNAGKAVTRILISKKSYKEGEYDTFPFTFFGDKAEAVGEVVKKGDVINIVGRIGVNKYEKDGKKFEKLELYGDDFTKAKYDETARSYIPLEEKLPWD